MIFILLLLRPVDGGGDEGDSHLWSLSGEPPDLSDLRSTVRQVLTEQDRPPRRRELSLEPPGAKATAVNDLFGLILITAYLQRINMLID